MSLEADVRAIVREELKRIGVASTAVQPVPADWSRTREILSAALARLIDRDPSPAELTIRELVAEAGLPGEHEVLTCAGLVLRAAGWAVGGRRRLPYSTDRERVYRHVLGAGGGQGGASVALTKAEAEAAKRFVASGAGDL